MLSEPYIVYVGFFQKGFELILWFGIIDKRMVLIWGNSWCWAMLIRSLCVRAMYDLFGDWVVLFIFNCFLSSFFNDNSLSVLNPRKTSFHTGFCG